MKRLATTALTSMLLSVPGFSRKLIRIGISKGSSEGMTTLPTVVPASTLMVPLHLGPVPFLTTLVTEWNRWWILLIIVVVVWLIVLTVTVLNRHGTRLLTNRFISITGLVRLKMKDRFGKHLLSPRAQLVNSISVVRLVELTVQFPAMVPAAPLMVLSGLAMPCMLPGSLVTLVTLLVPLATGLQVLSVMIMFVTDSTVAVETVTLQRFVSEQVVRTVV